MNATLKKDADVSETRELPTGVRTHRGYIEVRVVIKGQPFYQCCGPDTAFTRRKAILLLKAVRNGQLERYKKIEELFLKAMASTLSADAIASRLALQPASPWGKTWGKVEIINLKTG